MYNLRYLRIFGSAKLKVYPPQDFQSFPNSLRYLEWDGWPLKYLPQDFCPENLVTLKLPNSQLEQLWKDDEVCFNSSHLVECNLSYACKI